MKGPSERLKYDLRRVWECPVCKHHERTEGHVTSRLCRCQAKASPLQRQWMNLIEDGPRRVLGQPGGSDSTSVRGESVPASLGVVVEEPETPDSERGLAGP